LWRINLRKRNKIQAQPLRKQVCAGQRLDVRDVEEKGSKSNIFDKLNTDHLPSLSLV
jgi:hypothetical protein